jgi:hypothetical protein
MLKKGKSTMGSNETAALPHLKLSIDADWLHLGKAAQVATDYLIGPYVNERRDTIRKSVIVVSRDHDGAEVAYCVWGDKAHVRVRQERK